MIVELFLIGQLLAKRSFMDTPPSVIGPVPDKPPDAPKPIREPTGYRYDVEVYKFLKG